MKKLILFALLAAALLTAAAYLLSRPVQMYQMQDTVVALNEIGQLADAGQAGQASAKAAELAETLRTLPDTPADFRIPLMYGISLLFLAAATAYGCIAVVRPFEKLSRFADEIANGNFDLPLRYERSNYFGKFTWGFDRMRREITNARACEKAAIENNKTVIASLSHDIKTPVASVRAYAEALDMGMDQTPELRAEYLSTMMRKCDEITKLTDDMLLHALSDLGSLHMNPQCFDLGALTEQTVRDLTAGTSDIRFTKPLFTAEVYADPVRIAQVLENLIHNARKYAGTEIAISITRDADGVQLHVQDTGGGIPDSDLPFICERFYRGKNCGTAPGAGLGLYIVRYIAEQSGGTLTLENRGGGLHAAVTLPAGSAD
ncbi:MAG: HAMP domain-containing histidine kinase [Oscillospiraceae bacterium]|nr:HAMP domain-containing histidine kinase [Oscillospiraceae bacterium]